METIFTIIPTFNDDLSCNLLVRRTFRYEGEVMKTENWRCVLEKGADLTVPLATSFGEILLNDYPAERDYILAKWAEVEA
jgi:hypothetical protein